MCLDLVNVDTPVCNSATVATNVNGNIQESNCNISRNNIPNSSTSTTPVKQFWLVTIAGFIKRLSPDMAATTRAGSSHTINQDSVLESASGYPLVAVADGVGQSNQGEKASRAALMPLAISRPEGRIDLERLAYAADAWVKESFALFGAGRPGQTTLVAATIMRGSVVDFISIGDSRIFLLRPKGCISRRYVCEQITVDQTHGERKKRVIYKNPDIRNDLMFHAVGAGLLASEVKAHRRVIPPGGLMLLATDGFFKGMGENHCEEIARIAALHAGQDAAQLAQSLVAEAADRFDTGDDISVAVIIPSYLLGARWPFWVGGLLMFIAVVIRIYS